MANVKASDLIQAKALGCLDPEEDAALNKLMEEDPEFPWEELGQYQNLVALLPTLLEVEQPEQLVKDNVAKKLYDLVEKAKQDKQPETTEETSIDLGEGVIADVPDAEPPASPVTEKAEPEKKPELPKPETTPKSTPPPVNIPVTDKFSRGGISIKEHGIPMIPMDETAEPKKKSAAATKVAGQTTVQKEKPEEKKVKSQVSKYPVEETVIVKKDKKGMITAIVLFIISLVALAVVYIMLSSEIDDNRKEIQQLKQKLGSGLIMPSGINLHEIFNDKS